MKISVLMILFLLPVELSFAGSSSSSVGNNNVYQQRKLNSGNWSRLQQRWRQRELERQQRRQQSSSGQHRCSGTRICWIFPSCQQLQSWYGTGTTNGFLLDDDDETHMIRWRRTRQQPRSDNKDEEDTTTTLLVQSWLQPHHHHHHSRDNDRSMFNHNCVGMTNPALSIDTTPELPIGFRATRVGHSPPNDVQPSTTPTQTAAVTSSSSPNTTSLSQIAWTSARKVVDQHWWPGSTWIPHTENGKNRQPSWRVLKFRETVGRGEACYRAVRDAALEWEFHDDVRHRTSGIVPVIPRAGASWTSSGLGRRFVTYTHVAGPCYIINPVTVIYELIDQMGGKNDHSMIGITTDTTYTSTAYATNTNHWIAGEERVTVIHRKQRDHHHGDEDGVVDVEIVSISKPNPHSIMGRIVWPFIGARQRTFFEQQMEAFRRIASAAAEPKTR